jgi:hypothetical protein
MLYGALCETYGWAHDAWRRMSWAELWAWLRARDRMLGARARAQQASPDSWAGRDRDGWWAQQDQRRRQMRGGG